MNDFLKTYAVRGPDSNAMDDIDDAGYGAVFPVPPSLEEYSATRQVFPARGPFVSHKMIVERITMTYQLAPLPYAYDALEPYIDARTLEIHHDKHHAAYLNNLNKALEGHPELQTWHAEDLLKELHAVPESICTAVRNNGGGFVNHTFYWESMAPQAGGEPPAGSPLAEAIRRAFGDFAAFKEKFSSVTVARFGSGWGWLSLDKEGELLVHSTPNQESPLSEGLVPLLTCDVWEHAYYLNYQNRRPDYVSAWWNVVNWQKVAERFAAARN